MRPRKTTCTHETRVMEARASLLKHSQNKNIKKDDFDMARLSMTWLATPSMEATKEDVELYKTCLKNIKARYEANGWAWKEQDGKIFDLCRNEIDLEVIK